MKEAYVLCEYIRGYAANAVWSAPNVVCFVESLYTVISVDYSYSVCMVCLSMEYKRHRLTSALLQCDQVLCDRISLSVFWVSDKVGLCYISCGHLKYRNKLKAPDFLFSKKVFSIHKRPCRWSFAEANLIYITGTSPFGNKEKHDREALLDVAFYFSRQH